MAALGVPVDPSFAARSQIFLNELDRWNRVFRLTGYPTEAMRVRHLLLDSLLFLPVLPAAASPLLDIGSGAGVPGATRRHHGSERDHRPEPLTIAKFLTEDTFARNRRTKMPCRPPRPSTRSGHAGGVFPQFGDSESRFRHRLVGLGRCRACFPINKPRRTICSFLKLSQCLASEISR